MGMNANLKDTSTSTATIYNGCKLVRVTTPSRTLLVADAFYWPSWGNSSSIINTVLEEKIGVKYRHLRSANVAFSDGHVEGEKLYMPTEILDL
jgi:prepilin-type processing-associated H-X9-DG protein